VPARYLVYAFEFIGASDSPLAGIESMCADRVLEGAVETMEDASIDHHAFEAMSQHRFSIVDGDRNIFISSFPRHFPQHSSLEFLLRSYGLQSLLEAGGVREKREILHEVSERTLPIPIMERSQLVDRIRMVEQRVHARFRRGFRKNSCRTRGSFFRRR
jgi:hypothetical protein